jgi:hypothetical protein
VPPLILGTILLCLLLLLSTALGRRLLRWLGVVPASALEHGVFAAGLGLGSLQFVSFTLFALGIGRPTVFAAALGVLALLLVPDMGGSVQGGRRWLRQPHRLAWWEWAVAGLLVLLLTATYLRALCPITDDDGLSYHLAAPVRFLQQGRFIQIPTLTYTNWPLGVESLFALLVALHPVAPVGIVQFCFAALALVAVYLYARRLAGRGAGAATAVLMLAYKVYWEEAQQAHVDLGTMVFAVLAVFALAHTEGEGAAGDWRRLSALFAGLAATTKLNGLWVVISLMFVTWLLERRRAAQGGQAGGARRGLWRPILGYGLIAACVVAPWFVRTWVLTGNPVYPILYDLFGGKEWTAEGWPRIQRYFLLMNTPPGAAPTHVNLLLMRAALVGLALGVLLLVIRAARRSALLLPAGFAACFMMLVLMGSGYNLRFLLAAYPCVILIVGVSMMRAKAIGPRLAPVLCVAILFMGIRSIVRAIEPSLPTAIRVATGQITREEYLRSVLPDFRVVEYANRELPSDARILVATWEESTAYYKALALRPNYWLQDSVHYDSEARLVADLTRLGVTHLVIRPMDEEWCAKSAVCSGRMNTESRALAELARQSGTKLHEADGTQLYAIDLTQRSMASKGTPDVD